MDKTRLPSADMLNLLLTYEPSTGLLYWRERPVEMFIDGRQSAQHNAAIWNGRYANKPAFTAESVNGYRRGTIDGVHFLAHRVIWKMMTGDTPDEIDHENGNPRDNRWANLRAVDRATNFKNKKVSKNNKLAVMGVCKGRRENWRAYAWDGRKQIHLGEFATIDEAKAARKSWEASNGYHMNHGRV